MERSFRDYFMTPFHTENLTGSPDGSERELGIPTVTDRLIQQALLQVL
jgi:retron-type reverse transcriptase